MKYLKNQVENLKGSKLIRKLVILLLFQCLILIEALKASDYLLKNFNISSEVIDLILIKPIDWDEIFLSIEKTGRILVVDTGFTTGSVAGVTIANIVTKNLIF